MTAFDVVVQGAGAGAACFGAGVLWTMQVLNYPLLALVGPEHVAEYETAHNRRFAGVVAPPLVVALAAAIIQLFTGWFWPGIPGIVLIAVIIAITARYGAPAHTKLTKGFDPAVHSQLVRTNWTRTGAWTLLAVLDVVVLCRT